MLFQASVVSATLVHFLMNDLFGLARDLHNILCFLNPQYPLMGCLNYITKVGFQQGQQVGSFSCFCLYYGQHCVIVGAQNVMHSLRISLSLQNTPLPNIQLVNML